jgi:hypothetical protein
VQTIASSSVLCVVLFSSILSMLFTIIVLAVYCCTRYDSLCVLLCKFCNCNSFICKISLFCSYVSYCGCIYVAIVSIEMHVSVKGICKGAAECNITQMVDIVVDFATDALLVVCWYRLLAEFPSDVSGACNGTTYDHVYMAL